MMNETEPLPSLDELRAIRRAIERAGEPHQGPSTASLRTHLTIQCLGVVIFAVLTLLDIVPRVTLTDRLYATFVVETFRYLAVLLMLGMLVGLTAIVYVLVWTAARRANEDMTSFIGRNFRYLSLASLTSDLFIKFSAVSLVILAGRPDWVSAIIIACAGDYLIQGRGFVLPIRYGMLLGLLYLTVATIILIWFEGYLRYGFIAILAAASFSALHLRASLKAEAHDK